MKTEERLCEFTCVRFSCHVFTMFTHSFSIEQRILVTATGASITHFWNMELY